MKANKLKFWKYKWNTRREDTTRICQQTAQSAETLHSLNDNRNSYMRDHLLRRRRTTRSQESPRNVGDAVSVAYRRGPRSPPEILTGGTIIKKHTSKIIKKHTSNQKMNHGYKAKHKDPQINYKQRSCGENTQSSINTKKHINT